MPSQDVDARALEQLLRTTAPPATLTATYRYQVVRAAVEARSQVVSFRHRLRCLAAALLLCGALLLPSYLLTETSPRSRFFPVSVRLQSVNSVGPAVNSLPSSADGFDISPFLQPLQARSESWAAARQGRRL